MRITILNGNPDGADESFDGYVGALADDLSGRGHDVTALVLRELDVKACVGCFGCWVKKPGDCVVEDDAAQVRRAYMAADLVLLASPLAMGFYSPLLKKSVDKLLPNLLPQIGIYSDECHHKPRYDHYPQLAYLVRPDELCDDEDLAILRRIAERQALDLKTDLAGWYLAGRPATEVADAIDGI